MSNPFEKYFQATERQHDKINRMTPNWEVPASSPFVPFDTSLDARYSELNKPYIPDPTLKSAGDLLVDAAASALKIPTIIGGVAVGAADLALSAASKPFEWAMDAGHAVRPDLIPKPMEVGYGYIAKGLHDTIGYRPEEAKAFIDEKLFSDARKIQEKEYQSGYTAAEDKAFQDIWVSNYQAQIANLQKAGATEQQLKDFNTGFDKQYQEAATQRADKYQTSWDRPLSENIDIIGHGFNSLLENPSLALGGAIESGGYLLPSILVSRGVLALEKAANIAKIEKVAAATMAGKSIGELAITRSPFLAAGVGEGSVAGTVSLEHMRSQMPDGIAGGRELLGALGVAGSTGLIGGAFGKAASKLGVGDIDATGLGRAASQVAAMKLPALVRPVGAIAQEGTEEFLQTFGESIIPNVTMGKDPLEGLGQELPLGTMAGAIMGAGMNAPSLVTGGFSDISSGLGKVKGAVSDAASLKSFETLSNPEHKNYNPAQAFNSQVKNLESNDETVRTKAQASVDRLHADLQATIDSTNEQLGNIKTALDKLPTPDKMTDAQKLEVEALHESERQLQTKSAKLTDHFVALVDAQVMAQEHRDAQQGTQFTEEQAKADIATLTSAEGVDPNAQQEALNRVQRHFSKYSSDDLDLLASSPVLTETQRNSLRLMSKSKRELAAVQDPSQVFDNILNGYKGKTIRESHRGLNQYTDMVNTAVATKNEQLAQLALDGLGAFTDDHTAKRDTINEAYGLVQKGTYAEVHALRTQEGTWGLVPFTAQEVKAGKNTAGANYLSKEALNEVGGLNIHINSDKPVGGRAVGTITQINNETQLIQDRFNALSQVAESFVGATPKPVDTSTAPTVDTPTVTEPSDTTATVDTPVTEAPVQSGEPATPTEPIETKTLVEPEPIIPETPQEAVANEEVSAAIADARQAVRELLTQLNFQFVDSSNVNLTDIERIASKYLTGGKSNNDPAYLKDAATALSYAIYFELGLPQGSAATREWLQESLLNWLSTGEVPKTHKNVWVKAFEVFNRIMSAFSGKEFKTLESRLETTLSKIINREDFSFKPKQGYAKLVFQKEMTNNPLAVQSILTLLKSGISFSLTGSIAYADQVPVYRQENKPLHDMDFLLKLEDIDKGIELFKTGDQENWGDSFELYSFKAKGQKTVGMAVVPKGYVIKNAVSFWNNEVGAPQRSYDVYDVATGEKAGEYSFLRGVEETFTGVAGITIDLIGDDREGTVEQTFKDASGSEHTIQVSNYIGGFSAKLNMLRYKDITDFIAVVPSEKVVDTLSASRAEEARKAKEAPAKVVLPVNVWASNNENAGLSNLATRPFTFGTKKYQSVEHAYQTLKSGSFDQQTYDKYAGTENKKIAGNRGTKTTNNANISLMEKLMTASFEQNPDAMALLQKTGDAVITHTQDKSIWGKELPRILMEIRESNRAPTPTVEAATPPVTPTPSQDTPDVTEDTGKDNKADLILPIGTSGSGKSTWIKSVNSEGNYTVISLDDLRVELTGDVDNKTSDEAVYVEAIKRAVDAVKVGKQAIFDTTNLKKDRRVAIIDAIRKAKPNANIQYKLLPLDPALAKQRIKDALASGEARANVDDATIDRHAKAYVQALEDIKQEGITAFPEIVDSNKIGLALQGYTNHSGGAYGADTLWDTVGRSLGFTNHNHYRDGGNQGLSAKLKQAGVKAVVVTKEQMQLARDKIKDLLGVTYLDNLQGNLQVRNFYQVSNSDGVYAVATLSGSKAVKGGTNTAVQLGIKLGKPVYVWDVASEQWFKFDTTVNQFKPTETPILTENYAGVGTRDIENYNVLKDGEWASRKEYVGDAKAAKAQQAIKDVYVKTLASLKPKAEPEAKTTNDSRVLTELNLSVQQIRDVTSDLKNHVSLETVNTNTSRQTAQLGSDYTYSGKTYIGQPIPTHIKAWMDAVNKALGTAYNSVLVQYYPANTKSGIGFHKDNEKEQFDINQPVVSLSIGQTIPFVVHEKLNTPVTFNLKSGDVFKFDGNKLHGIASQNHTGERYSLTLRQFHKTKTSDTTPPVGGKAKDVVAELKQSHSGLLSAETKGTLDTLLDLSINLFPSTLVQFIKDVSQIPTRLKVNKFTYGKTIIDPDNARQAHVFINPEGKVDKDGKVASDLYETIVHEFIHAATVGYLNSNFEGTQYKTLLSLVDAVHEYLESQPSESQDNIVLALRNIVRHENPVAQVQELLAYGLTHSVVSEWAKATPYAWSTETNKGISDASQALLEGNAPKTVYDALLAVYGNIIQIEERNNALLQAKRTPNDNGTIEGGVGGASDTNDTSIKEQSAKSDGGTGTGNVEVEQTSTESQVEPRATEDAKVTVLQGVTDERAAEERKKPFNLRNILKGYFTQSTTKEDATGANPLVTVKDFLSNFDVRTQVSDWLNDRRKPTQKQLEQVEHFKKFHAEFARALKFVFNTQASAIFVSNKENLVGYLEMGKKPSTRELDENVVTALALSAYSYLIKQGNKVMNTNEELETLFRLKKGMRAPLEIEQMFRFAGQEMPIVVKALGTDTAKALGLKVREDQDPTLQDRLNTSLGILAMEAMAKAGFIVIETLQDHPTDEKNKPLTDFLTTIKTVRESKAHTSEDEYDFEVDTDVETKISKFTMVRPNAKMEGIGNSVFEKGIIETEVDGKIVRTETLTLNRPVLTEGLPTLNSALVNELIEANKETKGFLSYLFGVDVGLTTPLKEIPKKFSQRLINGTDASVPSVQAELLTEAQKHSFTMRTNTVAVFAAMQKLGENSQFLKEVLGIWVDDHVLSRTHVTERDSLQAKAQNDWTAVLNGLEWAEATLDENGQYTQFYDTQFVAQNQRQHLNSNMFSAQSSQIHRAMAALTGFSTTIDLTKDAALLNLFYQAVGEGLEGLDDYLKADILAKAEAGLHQFFTVDKVYGDYYVPALKAFLETDASKNAIEAMRALIETGTINTDQQKDIAAFVNKGKMGAQSLQSLIALAELDIAQDSKEQIFTTTIGFGSDGVNHGVSAANMLTGVISKDMRQQTGIFPIAEKGEDQIDNMQEVYRRKITDYYVDFGKVMAAKLRDLIPTFVGKLNTDFVEGMQALFPKFEALDDTGELKNLLAMRKMAKIWAIPFNYSAGKAALQRALARGFLAGIYGEMNKLANGALDIIDAQNKKGVTAEELAALDLKMETVKLKTTTLQDNLNKVLGKYGMGVTLPEPQLLNEEDKGKLSSDLENTLMQAAIDLHGKAAWQATEEFAKDYLEVRNVYTEVEKASFTLFDVVRNQLIEEKKASRKYSNVAAKVQVKGKTVQYTAEEINAQEAEYFGLTTVELAEIDAVLAAMRPMFNTALSIGSESTNDASNAINPSGVSVRKHKMQREPAKGLRAVNTFYLKEIDANGKPFSEARNVGLTKEVEENAGVASSANAVQSVDAFVAAKIQGFMVALNAHDNAIFGLKDFLKGVKKQNEEHLKALTNYQLGLEHAKMSVKVYQGYKAFMATQEEALKTAEGKVKENIQSIINQANKEMDKLLKGEVIQRGGKNLVIDGEIISKGGLIPKLKAAGIVIDDNATIEQAIGMFIEFAINQDVKKLGMLKDTFGIHQFAGEGGMHQLTDDNRASIDEQKALVNKAKEDLQAKLKDKTVEEVAEVKTPEATKQVSPKVATVEKPMSPLVKFLESKKDTEMFVGDLIQYMKSDVAIDDKLNAQQQEVLKALEPLLNASTKVVYADATYEGYGYFDEPTNTIHIKSEQSEGSNVNSQLAIHELLHSVLSLRIKALDASIAAKTVEATKTGKPATFTPAEAALNKLDELRQIILSRVKGIPALSEMLKNVDEFISYGLTDQRLQQVLGAVPVERNGRTAPKVNSKWRTFVLAVMKVTGFKSGGTITALSAFAMDTAALLETIGSVTPVVAPNNGERLFSTQSAEDLVNGQSSLDTMQALPHSNTGAFNQQLDRLITEEIGQLYNQDDAAKARIDEIQTLTASDALNAGFTLSRKEQYVQQALQYAVAAYRKLHGGGANEGQLNRVYHAAKVKIDPTGKDFHEGDWATATQQEQDAAKAKYDFLFESTKEGYMDRFVSMALASESVSKILDIALPLTKPETQDKTWFEKVSDWVAYVMAWLTNKYVRLNPTAGASNQLVQLMSNLVSLDIRARQEGVAFHQKAWNSIGLVTTPLNNFIKKGQDAALKGDGLSKSRFLPVRALGAAIVLRSEEAAKAIPQLILDMRNNQLPHTKLGEAANILMEAASAGSMRNAFDVLTRQTNLNAKNRQDIVDNVKKAVNGWFKTPLTKMQHKAITYVLLRTDTQALLEDYSVEDVVNMALHEGKLNAEIAKLKKEIAKNPNGNDMLNAAEQLGYYMVTRIGGEGLVKNATGIAIGLGTQYFTSVEQADAKLVHQLDVLASMMAMSYTPNSDKAIVAALYKTDKDGVHATINLHNGLVTQATGLFQDNPLNKVKGWMPEITNPYREIKTAESMAEREQMEAEGWVFVAEVKRDKHDKGNPKYLMKHNDIGYQRFVSGAVDLLNPSRSGTEAIDRTNPKYLGITQARYQNAARRAAIPNGSFDPSKQPRGLITAYDTNGVPLAYNYEMDNETRNDVLDRNHNIGDLLGTFGGKNYYTPVKTKQNSAVAQVLFEDYRDNYSQNPNAYIKLSPKSTDPKVVEMWRMLPQDFKDQATALYGKGNPIVIRNEAFNFAFGFKKFSLVSNAFDAVKAERERIAKGLIGVGKAPNAFQSGFVRFAEASSKFKSGVIGTFGGTNRSTAQADFAKAEHVTQEIVKAIKDFIVIRSGTTMFWNIFANVLMLMANGINPFTIVQDWVFAVTNVRAYQKLNSQLIQAQADLIAGKDPVALKQKIGALKAELKANKMNPYINAGLLSSIVEDVNIQSGDYTYNSAFKQAVDEKTQWIPKPVKTAAKVLTIAPSTKLYQFLATTTQLSDFVAKYTMSKHLQANGMAMDESVVEASKTFINYDLPTSQGLQYANDMGLFMFTKFFLRIQAVLMKLMGKKAGSVIAQHILVESLTGAEGILSPSLFNHIGNNPLEPSVFGLPSAFFSIGTVDAVTGAVGAF